MNAVTGAGSSRDAPAVPVPKGKAKAKAKAATALPLTVDQKCEAMRVLDEEAVLLTHLYYLNWVSTCGLLNLRCAHEEGIGIVQHGAGLAERPRVEIEVG